MYPNDLSLENRIPDSVKAELEKRGHRLQKGRSAIGDANEILIQGNVAWAYADTREVGSAMAAKPAAAAH